MKYAVISKNVKGFCIDLAGEQTSSWNCGGGKERKGLSEWAAFSNSINPI